MGCFNIVEEDVKREPSRDDAAARRASSNCSPMCDSSFLSRLRFLTRSWYDCLSEKNMGPSSAWSGGRKPKTGLFFLPPRSVRERPFFLFRLFRERVVFSFQRRWPNVSKEKRRAAPREPFAVHRRRALHVLARGHDEPADAQRRRKCGGSRLGTRPRARDF